MLAYAYTKWANPDRDADWWIRTGASYMSTDQGWIWDGTGKSHELLPRSQLSRGTTQLGRCRGIRLPGLGPLHRPRTTAHP